MLADAWLTHGPSATGRGTTNGRQGFSFGVPVHSYIPRQRGWRSKRTRRQNSCFLLKSRLVSKQLWY